MSAAPSQIIETRQRQIEIQPTLNKKTSHKCEKFL